MSKAKQESGPKGQYWSLRYVSWTSLALTIFFIISLFINFMGPFAHLGLGLSLLALAASSLLKIVNIKPDHYYIRYNELGHFSSFIGNGLAIIRRWEKVDFDAPALTSTMFEIHLKDITTMRDKRGFKMNVPVSLLCYIDWGLMAPDLQAELYDEVHNFKIIQKAANLYVQRVLQESLFNIAQENLGTLDAFRVLEAVIAQKFYTRGKNPLIDLAAWYKKPEEKGDSPNPYGIVLREFAGVPALSNAIDQNREKAYSATFRTLETLNMSEREDLSINEIMQLNSATNPNSRSTVKAYVNMELEQESFKNRRKNSEAEAPSEATNEAKQMPETAANENTVQEEENRFAQLQLNLQNLLQMIVRFPINLALEGFKSISLGLKSLQEKPAKKPEGQGDIILVKPLPNETAEVFAKRHNTSLEEVLQLNKLQANESLKDYGVLALPAHALTSMEGRLSIENETNGDAQPKSSVRSIWDLDSENIERSEPEPNSNTINIQSGEAIPKSNATNISDMYD